MASAQPSQMVLQPGQTVDGRVSGLSQSDDAYKSSLTVLQSRHMVNDFIGLCSSVSWMVVHLGPAVDGVGRWHNLDSGSL
jgi:hypothetical protein